MTSDKETPLKDLRALYRMMSRPRRKDLLLLLAVMLLAAAAEVAIIGSTVPFLLLALTPDRAPPLPWPTAPGGSSLIAAAMLLSGAAIVAALVRLLLAGMSQSFALKLGHELGTTMFSRMLRQPYGYYVARNTSELLVGMEKVQTVVHGLLLPVVQGVSGGVLALCVAALLFLLNPYAAALVAPTLAAVYFAISVVTRRRLKSNSAIVSQSSTARMKLVREGLGGIRDILLDRSQA
ncbi:MAG TPA: ABC transporter transmembrane domain-containing protein, partial [Longimicrobium sp.]